MAEQFQKIMTVDANDVADPAEVAAVFEIVFKAIATMKDEADSAEGSIRRTLNEKAAELTRTINGLRKNTNTSHQALKKIVDSLVLWRTREEARTTDEDIDEMRELHEANAATLEDIQKQIDSWKLKKGTPGKPGKIPAHEWEGTKIRFEQEDGTWGDWVDLQGAPGQGGGFSVFGQSGLSIQRITSDGTSGPASLSPGGTLNIPNYTSAGGSTLSVEVPADAINDSNLNFVFSKKPLVIVMNQGTYRNDAVNGWTWNGATLTATMPSVPGTGGDIYALISS